MAVAMLLVAVDGLVLYLHVDRLDGSLPGSRRGGTTYLLVGSDERTGIPGQERDRFGTADEVPGRRADVVVAIRVLDDGTVKVLGIPRDLTVLRAGRGPERLALTLEDGVGAVADGLCNSLGLGVDHAVLVDFAGLRALVDHVGGVEVDADVDQRDPMSGMALTAGRNELDGSEAIAYVRARSIESRFGDEWAPDPVRSAQRPERAVDVLAELAAQLSVSPSDPIGAHRTAWAVGDALSVDGGAGPTDLLQLLDAAGDLDRSTMATLPVSEREGPFPMSDPAPGAPATITRFQGDHDPADGDDPCPTAAILGGA
jgi:LCP family protein required for cell wall assembly